MAKSKQMCDVAATKGLPRGWSNEQLRNFSATAYNRKLTYNFDPTRERLNFEVTKGGLIVPVDKRKSIVRRIAENMKARGIKDPNLGKEKPDIRTVANFILGGSREQMHRLAFGEQLVNLNHGADNSGITRNGDIEKWAVDTYNFLADKYGEDNIIAFVVHLDETNPHVHATVLPVTEQNKISWKQVMVGQDKYEYRQRMMQLHDEFAEINKKWGLERGDAVAVTGARHRSTEEYRDWLDSQAQVLEQQIDTKRQTLYELNAEISKAEKRLKGLTTMLMNLENRKTAIEQEISSLESQVRQGQLSADEMMQRKQLLRQELDGIIEKIKERQKQIQTARQQLQDVADRRAELDEQAKEIEKRIKQDLPTLHEKTMRDVRSTGWKIVAEDAMERMNKLDEHASTLPPEERKIYNKVYEDVFDGSVFEEMAERANEIAAVAAALFLGYVDQATQFAQSHGGGGGGPSGGWGRKKDDDDEAWRRKCFFMGMKMMRPAGRKLKR